MPSDRKPVHRNPALPASALWAVRDSRTLSAYAKLAYAMLWTRGKDIHPSMQTLADDMGASLNTAKRAVRELESAGWLKRITRLTVAGDNDSNRFELAGEAREAPPPGLTGPTGTAPQAPKDRTLKEESEGRNSLASRRARPAVSRDDRIHFARRAVTISYSAAEAEDITDGQAVALHYLLINNRQPADHVAYLCKIFADTPDLNTHLANAGTEEDWDAA